MQFKKKLLLQLAVGLVTAGVRLHGQAPAALDVLTQHNDNARTGGNLAETTLTADNVSPTTFGLVFSLGPLDGYVYAQPLFVSQLAVGTGKRNVLYVATEHNSVYAFDADGTQAAPLWQVNLGPSAPQDPVNDPQNATIQDCLDLTPEVGITSTPVIDRTAGAIYVVAKTRDAGGAYHQRLWSLDLTDGRTLASVEISATVQNSAGSFVFDPQLQLNRPALLLTGGTLVLGFGSHCDTGPYNGWVLGYDATTLQQTAAYLVTPTGTEGSIWQSGQGLAADADGSIYLISSNGTNGGDNVSDSFVRLSTAGGTLSLADWFTPSDSAALDEGDSDLGSGGPLLIPGSNVVVGGGKEGRLYVIDRANMGHTSADDSGAIETFQLSDEAFSHEINGGPVYWASPAGGRMYLWPSQESLKAFAFDGTLLDPTPIAMSGATAPMNSFPGGTLSLSANGSTARSGIVWASVPASNGNETTVPGVLRAFDAENIAHELWNSEINPADQVSAYAKFTPPTVANGRVYLATFAGQIQVYGLGNFSEGGGGNTLPAPWVTEDVGQTGLSGSAFYSNGTFTVKGAGADIWGTSDAFRYVSQPASGDTQVSARFLSMDNTNSAAKSGVMLRTTLDPSAAFVILDENPSGSIEFMTRSSAGEAVQFLTGSFQPTPAFLRLTRVGGTVTADVSADGTTWTTAGTAAFPEGAANVGLVVCSHDTSTLNTSIFDTVAVTIPVTTGAGGGGAGGAGGGAGASLPAPWTDEDIGATGQAGSASFDNGSFTLQGAGADIWGTVDAFHYADQAVAGDTQLAARVVTMQNTSQWAKAGVMLRSSLDASAPFVILDETPTGAIEFMTRSAAGAAVQFVAGASQPMPTFLRLSRAGANVTAAVSIDGANWTTVGTTTFPPGSALVGLAVCSHDTSTLNAATFDSVTLAAPSGGVLPSPWLNQDVGTTGAAGSASFSSGTFTVQGAGGDIWGTSDAFQFVHQPVSADAQLVARVASMQNTSQWAKAGVMLRTSVAPDAPFVLVDATPEGGVEFMARTSAGAAVQFIAGASQPAPAWLRLTRNAGTVIADVSSDGASWTEIGSASFMQGNAEIGLIVCSHDTSTLNTATFDSVAVTASSGTGGEGGGSSTPANVVIYGSAVTSLHGSWATASDATAAAGFKLVTSNAGVANTNNALASPVDYFDVSFNAVANTPYTIWLRLQALNNDKFNDSVWVQFSDAMAGGTAVYPIGTTSGLLVNLATDGTGASLNGWGWQNGAYWLAQSATVTFPTTGSRTLRVQVREDGVEIDQIVLSPSSYLQTAPGPPTNDSTIVQPAN